MSSVSPFQLSGGFSILVAVGKIHPSAVIDRNARLGYDCEVGPYSVVEEGAVIGRGCRLDSHVVIKRRTEIGEEVRVSSGAIIGGDPQDLAFDPETVSRVVVGEGSTLREGVTLHRSIKEGGVTAVGKGVFMMAFSHAGHDCRVGDGAVLANGALLAGHVTLGARSFVGGGAGIHQHCRIGECVMVGGNAAITKDVPPGLSVADRNHLIGLNAVGLKRLGFSSEEINAFKTFSRRFYSGEGRIRERARRWLEEEPDMPELCRRFTSFFLEGTRGFVVPGRE